MSSCNSQLFSKLLPCAIQNIASSCMLVFILLILCWRNIILLAVDYFMLSNRFQQHILCLYANFSIKYHFYISILLSLFPLIYLHTYANQLGEARHSFSQSTSRIIHNYLDEAKQLFMFLHLFLYPVFSQWMRFQEVVYTGLRSAYLLSPTCRIYALDFNLVWSSRLSFLAIHICRFD